MSGVSHWQDWHRAYDVADSSLSRRLAVVERELANALDELPRGPRRLLSLCSGDGRDVLDVLGSHRRARDVDVVLVDLEATLLERAERRAAGIGVRGFSTVLADAGRPRNYDAAVPADVVLACGIFGNVSDHDVHVTVRSLPALLVAGGHVLWTRHRREPDLTGSIRGWFAAEGFEERDFEPVAGTLAAVGHHVWPAATRGATPEVLFEFVGDGTGAFR